MRSRGGRAEESDTTEVQIQLIREEEVLNDKAEYLPLDLMMHSGNISMDYLAGSLVDSMEGLKLSSLGGTQLNFRALLPPYLT